MAGQIDGLFLTGKAAAAVSVGRAMVVSSGTDYVAAAATGNYPIGIAMQSVEADDLLVVKTFFPTYEASVTGAPITRGDSLYVGAAGQLASTGTVAIAIALENAGTNGDIITVAGRKA
jgi:hypothetical protein